MSRVENRKYTGMVQSLTAVVREEGVLKLWKGNGANVIRVMPVYALKFAFNDFFKDLARQLRGAASGSTPERLTFSEQILAGSLAGLTQIVITYPLEVVRTRLTMGPGMGLHYDGIVDCFAQTLRSEGVAGLYKGIGPTILSGAPYVGLQMTGYDTLKAAATQVDFLSRRDASGAARPTLLASLACGALAGVFAQTGEHGPAGAPCTEPCVRRRQHTIRTARPGTTPRVPLTSPRCPQSRTRAIRSAVGCRRTVQTARRGSTRTPLTACARRLLPRGCPGFTEAS